MELGNSISKRAKNAKVITDWRSKGISQVISPKALVQLNGNGFPF